MDMQRERTTLAWWDFMTGRRNARQTQGRLRNVPLDSNVDIAILDGSYRADDVLFPASLKHLGGKVFARLM